MTRRAQAAQRRDALLLACLSLAALAACHGRAAEPRAPAQPAAATPAARVPAQPVAAAPPAPAPATPRLIVAVADLSGDRGPRPVKERVLAHLRAFVPGAVIGSTPGMRPDLALEILDVPHDVLALAGDGDGTAASDDSPFALLQHGHARARDLLDEIRASALIWGTAGARPVLYVTTAESAGSMEGPCADPAAAVDAGSPRHALCALETGATWLLCATVWAEIVPVGCAPAP